VKRVVPDLPLDDGPQLVGVICSRAVRKAS